MPKIPEKHSHFDAEDFMQRFVNARNRPAVFLFLKDSLELRHVLYLRQILGQSQFEEVDLVINSTGGDIHAAYQIVTLLRLHTEKLYACVPFVAKSAATLLCIGADTIVLDELAQLGPLDTQIWEEEKGRGEYVSALNPFKTLEQLQTFALETLDLSMNLISNRSGMGLDDCLKHSTSLVQVIAGPLIGRLDPKKLGEFSRSLSVGEEYGKRLLRRFTDWDEDKRDEVIQQLVHGYPSHDYIIDFRELEEMGFDVQSFDSSMSAEVQGLYTVIGKTDASIVKVMYPEAEAHSENNEVGPGSVDEEVDNDTEQVKQDNNGE